MYVTIYKKKAWAFKSLVGTPSILNHIGVVSLLKGHSTNQMLIQIHTLVLHVVCMVIMKPRPLHRLRYLVSHALFTKGLN